MGIIKKNSLLYWLAPTLVLLVWLCNFFIVLNISTVYNLEPGQVGDMFGAVNALFAGLAFAGIILTLIMQSRQLQLQRDELGLQRKELELTRHELARSADAQGITTAIQALTGEIHGRVALLNLYKEVTADGSNRLQGFTGLGQSEAKDLLRTMHHDLNHAITQLDHLREAMNRIEKN